MKKLLLILISLTTIFASCFVGKTVQRSKDLYKAVTNRTDSTGKPLVQTYYPKLEYAKTLYANENDRWNAANDAKRNMVVVNNLTNPLGLTSRSVALIKFDLSSLPQSMIDNPESIKEAALVMTGISFPEGDVSRLSPMMVKKEFNIETVTWKTKPKVEQFILSMGENGINGESRAVNVRPHIIKMLKRKKNYGFMIQPINDASKGDTVLENIMPSAKNGVMAEIPTKGIKLMIF